MLHQTRFAAYRKVKSNPAFTAASYTSYPISYTPHFKQTPYLLHPHLKPETLTPESSTLCKKSSSTLLSFRESRRSPVQQSPISWPLIKVVESVAPLSPFLPGCPRPPPHSVIPTTLYCLRFPALSLTRAQTWRRQSLRARQTLCGAVRSP